MCGRLTTRWTRRVHSPNLFERNTIVGYTTIDSRGHVATFQTAVYPRLPTFSKVHDVPIKRPYVGTCAQAICEGRTITCSNIATETGFDSSWRAACTGAPLIVSSRWPWRFCGGLLSRLPVGFARCQAQRGALQRLW